MNIETLDKPLELIVKSEFVHDYVDDEESKIVKKYKVGEKIIAVAQVKNSVYYSGDSFIVYDTSISHAFSVCKSLVKNLKEGQNG